MVKTGETPAINPLWFWPLSILAALVLVTIVAVATRQEMAKAPPEKPPAAKPTEQFTEADRRTITAVIGRLSLLESMREWGSLPRDLGDTSNER